MPLVLQRSWLGRRVVVRRALDGTQTGVLSDVIGELVSLDDEHAVLTTRAGEMRIEQAVVTHARLIEASTRDILALETLATRGWMPAETAHQNGWLLRADHGFSARANSVLALRDPVPDLSAALASARGWYAERALPLLIATPLPARAALDSALSTLGFTVVTTADVMVATTRSAAAAQPSGPPDALGPAFTFDVRPDLDDRWLAVYQHPTAAPPEQRTVAGALLARHDRPGFASIRSVESGEVVAVARAVVDDGWLGVSAVVVHPDHRRRGFASALMNGLSSWAARRHGTTRTYLQVESANTAAITMYRGLGFWRHHSYRYHRDLPLL
jgi:GNAT superfamily N-acetyltransferase